ncbi:hypothetical protein PQ456_13185 [Paenibacillus kyungheensis]|uniref:Pyrroloquinoline-quinone binding quinoprotein n=1 Tax=Paenibacillus kyungheensis TaxID=1452732 RepID=A0AAX3LWW2_9BACL|nr:hypothetical protein [Paenibacillus kyungheensis]WCT54157.1 hypothetical protein PQ456_13185 [Paenibacillus kyungheensis]
MNKEKYTLLWKIIVLIFLIHLIPFNVSHAIDSTDSSEIPVTDSLTDIIKNSIKSVQLADENGKLKSATYQMEFARSIANFDSIDSVFPDRSGNNIIVVYFDKNRVVKLASFQASNGKFLWETTLSKGFVRQTIYEVQDNGEIFCTTEDKNNFYLYTVNEKTGKITRFITQALPSKPSFLDWNYWILNNNELLMSFSMNNKSKLRYFDHNGKVIRTQELSGILRDVQNNNLLITSGTSTNVHFKVQDLHEKVRFTGELKDGMIWESYLFPDLSVALETNIGGIGENTFRLHKYNSTGKKEWIHTTINAYSPYKHIGDHIIVITPILSKVISLDKGKISKVLKDRKDVSISLKHKLLYFSDKTVRIADSKKMKWLAEINYIQNHSYNAWLNKQQLAIIDYDNKVLAVIKITEK